MTQTLAHALVQRPYKRVTPTLRARLISEAAKVIIGNKVKALTCWETFYSL
jgi:hypothetical protein